MKNVIKLFTITGLILIGTSTLSFAVTVDSVISAHKAGSTDNELRATIKSEGFQGTLAADDIRNLMSAGVSANVIDTLLDVEANQKDRKSTRLNSSHTDISRMPSSA